MKPVGLTGSGEPAPAILSATTPAEAVAAPSALPTEQESEEEEEEVDSDEDSDEDSDYVSRATGRRKVGGESKKSKKVGFPNPG